MGCTQLRNDGFIAAGDMVLFDASHPLEADTKGGGAGMAEVTLLRIPRSSLSLPAAQADGSLLDGSPTKG
ncbi:hypothetical protein [Streptomyces sp. NPDC094032]|uniref:hypothetical protein n=1 Tax=Streptomyces sp. NPDC094032 TaxID=3155308 RepID=UPI00332ABBE2